jgi:hypothetical protein
MCVAYEYAAQGKEVPGKTYLVRNFQGFRPEIGKKESKTSVGIGLSATLPKAPGSI